MTDETIPRAQYEAEIQAAAAVCAQVSYIAAAFELLHDRNNRLAPDRKLDALRAILKDSEPKLRKRAEKILKTTIDDINEQGFQVEKQPKSFLGRFFGRC